MIRRVNWRTERQVHYCDAIVGAMASQITKAHDCLLSRLFRRRSKKTAKLRATGLCTGNSPVTGQFPAQMTSNAANVSIWWHHHVHMRMQWKQHFCLVKKLRRYIFLIILFGNWKLFCDKMLEQEYGVSVGDLILFSVTFIIIFCVSFENLFPIDPVLVPLQVLNHCHKLSINGWHHWWLPLYNMSYWCIACDIPHELFNFR